MELSVEIVKVSFKQISLCRLCECCLQHQSSLSAPVPPTFSSDCVPTHIVGSGSGDHYLDWGAFSHRLFSQAPSKKSVSAREDICVQTDAQKLNCTHCTLVRTFTDL